ncbi:MAG: acetamidase/formamidase family protein [Acidimicrobiales bacterium]
MHELDANPASVHWGYFDRALAPVLTVASGDTVAVRTVTHHSGDAPELMMDDAVRALFHGVPPAERGPGPHVLTGPIAVDGALPGDVLEVRIRSLEPRFGHGSNLAANWGHLYPDFGKERVTIWSVDPASGTARAELAYDWKTTPIVDAPGTVVPPGSVPREAVAREMVVPLRPHLGTVGLAPAAPGRHSSVPPGDHGGNIDNWRAGPGTSYFLPVQVPGALLSMGDPHMAQGDAELSGTALEASLDAVVELHLRPDVAWTVPVLETPTHWHVHGFGDTLDDAMRATARRVLRFLEQTWELGADDAYSLASVGVDFAVTQVVDRRIGVHGMVAKDLVGG